MHYFVRTLLIIGGVLMLMLAAGFFWQQPMALELWLWPEDSALNKYFVAAMQAAIAAAMLWTGFSGELAALAAGALNLAVMMVGLVITLIPLARHDEYMGLAGYIIGMAIFVIFNLFLLVWSAGLPIRDPRPMPGFVKIAFGIFIAFLLAVGVALVLARPQIMPWNVGKTGVIFGWMFLSDAFYFAYPLWRGRWSLARAPLWSFLAYDLVLIGPFVSRLLGQAAIPEWAWPNLIVYTLVLVFSGAVAVYYLLINPATRAPYQPAAMIR